MWSQWTEDITTSATTRPISHHFAWKTDGWALECNAQKKIRKEEIARHSFVQWVHAKIHDVARAWVSDENVSELKIHGKQSHVIAQLHRVERNFMNQLHFRRFSMRWGKKRRWENYIIMNFAIYGKKCRNGRRDVSDKKFWRFFSYFMRGNIQDAFTQLSWLNVKLFLRTNRLSCRTLHNLWTPSKFEPSLLLLRCWFSWQLFSHLDTWS